MIICYAVSSAGFFQFLVSAIIRPRENQCKLALVINAPQASTEVEFAMRISAAANPLIAVTTATTARNTADHPFEIMFFANFCIIPLYITLLTLC